MGRKLGWVGLSIYALVVYVMDCVTHAPVEVNLGVK